MKQKQDGKRKMQAPTPSARYFVTRHMGQWKISFEGRLFGPWVTREEAIGIAVAEAVEAQRDGHHAAVLIQGANQLFKE